MEQLWVDCRLAIRSMRQRPWISALVVATLAVGLAANTTVYSVLDVLVRRPIRFPDPDRLMMAWETAPNEDEFERSNVAPANFLDWKAGSSEALRDLVALESFAVAIQGRELPERARGFKVSAGFFEMLQATPQPGRSFSAEEWQELSSRRLVIGHDLWRRSFAADPGLVGRSVLLDGVAHTVVGIAPRGFRFPLGAELWAPLVLSEAGAARDWHGLMVMGRLAEGRSLAEARARLAVVAARLRDDHPRTNASRGIRVESLSRGIEDPGARSVLLIWQGAALLLLLIACVNVANVVLARGTERRREMAVRLALGAARFRIVRQLSAEGLALAAAALVGSLPLSWLSIRELRDRMPAEIAQWVTGWESLGINGHSLAMTALLAAATVLFFSAWPALRSTRPALTEALRDGERSASAGPRGQRGRNALVVAEVAFALALLIAGAIAARGARRLLSGPQGYEPDGLLTLRVSLPETSYAEADRRRAFARDAVGALRRLAGAEAVSLSNTLPSSPSGSSRSIAIEGEPEGDPSAPPFADFRTVSADYFATLKVPILSGRALNDADDEHSLKVAVVSQSMARRYWPGRDPLGRRFRAGDETQPWLTVVGVSGDVIHHWFARRNFPTFYQPYEQEPSHSLALALRTRQDPELLAGPARRALMSVEPLVPAHDVWSQRRGLQMRTVGLQLGALVMGAFACLALILAVSGVYGVMAYRVAMRRREIGVRVALGATRADLLRLTLRQAGALAGLGLFIGLGLALGLGRAMTAAFNGAVAVEAVVFVALAPALAVAALGAAFVPARRALQVDPVEALRAE